MTDFTTSNVLGYGSPLDDSPENLLLNYVKNNWSLETVKLYHPVDYPYGLMFGLGYFGYNDLVCYAEQISYSPESIALGGRLDKVVYEVDLCFTIRDYGLEQMGQTPPECQYILDYIENFIDNNKTGLKSSGINYMWLKSINHGNRMLYGLQVFAEVFTVAMIHGNINL